jgi:hypothetical protein
MPTLTFKVTEEDAARIRRLARKERRTVSDYLRQRAIPASSSATSAGSYHIETSTVTGLPVMQAPAGTPPVSSEQVRELLADFP